MKNRIPISIGLCIFIMIFPFLVFGKPNNNNPITRITQLEEETASLSATAGEVLSEIVPVGTIAMWSGALDTLPEGWALCDGENGTPDLRERFVLGCND